MVSSFCAGFCGGGFWGDGMGFVGGGVGGRGVVFGGMMSRVLFPEGRLRYAISYEAAGGA